MIAQLAAALSSHKSTTRLEAVESLLEHAEDGADLTPALGALGAALSDVEGAVRECAGEAIAYHARIAGALGDAALGLVGALGDGDLAVVAGECLRLGLGGADAPEIVRVLLPALDGDDLQSRNAAGLLARHWMRSGAIERVVGLLGDARVLARQGACEAAVAEIRAGQSGAGLEPALPVLLMDQGHGVARRAAWLLIRLQPEQLPALLGHARAEVRLGALAALAEGCDAGAEPPADHAPVRGCLADPVTDIRQKAAYVLAALARTGAPMEDSVLALGTALSDAAPGVRHEAVLALLWLARAGQDLSAVEITPVLKNGGVRLRRNAAMAWGRHLVNRGAEDALARLLTDPDRHVRFGATWGVTERHLSRHDAGAVLLLLQHTDRLIGEAVVATMRQHREEGRSISAGLTALHLLQQDGLMAGARAQGLFAELLR